MMFFIMFFKICCKVIADRTGETLSRWAMWQCCSLVKETDRYTVCRERGNMQHYKL
jgi:hypothetical protein